MIEDTRPPDIGTIYERLAAPFDLADHGRVNKGGMDQTFAPWTAYVERMTDVLGVYGWSNRVVREGLTATEAWSLVEVEAEIEGRMVVRQQYGCEPIAKGQQAKPVTDLYKIAASDALKKAISLFGPGLYLSVKEEREEIERLMREAVREEAARQRGPGGRQDDDQPRGDPAPPRPRLLPEAPPAPLEAGARTALEHRYESLREHALALGFRTSWSGQGSQAWNDVQLPKYIGLLEQYISRQRAAS